MEVWHPLYCFKKDFMFNVIFFSSQRVQFKYEKQFLSYFFFLFSPNKFDFFIKCACNWIPLLGGDDRKYFPPYLRLDPVGTQGYISAVSAPSSYPKPEPWYKTLFFFPDISQWFLKLKALTSLCIIYLALIITLPVHQIKVAIH